MEDTVLPSLQIFLLLCYVRKLLTLSAQKFADFAISSTHYNIFQPNFRFLLLLIGSFREFRGGGDKTLDCLILLLYFIFA